MSKKIFNFILAAHTRGWQNVNKAQKGLVAFNREVKNGNKVMSVARSQIGQLLGAYLGFDAVRNTAAIIKSADTAAFNLQSSLAAANREFDDIGSIEAWGNSIERLSQKLRIYSKSDLKTAAARTIDMTKRLGMSREQMEEVIERTADLSAGKFELKDGIERVTAALRGEAEASEALGLTLNENYVKAWYEASEGYNKAWKDLTDLEKAQIRYQVFLEQAIPTQGKAAQSINTLAGAYALVRSRIHDSLTENRAMVEVTKELARYLAEHADEVGDFAAMVARGVAATAKWMVANRELLAWAGKIGFPLLFIVKIVGMLIKVYDGVNAAMVAMTGSRLLSWFKNLGQAQIAAARSAGALTTALRGGVALAAAYGALKIAELIKVSYQWYQARQLAAAAADGAAAAEGRYQDRLKRASEAAGKTLSTWREVRQAYKDGLIDYDEATDTYTRGSGRRREAYQVELAAAREAAAGEKQAAADVAAAVRRSAAAQEKVTADALEKMREQYQQYVGEVKRLTAEIDGRRSGLKEQLRDMGRSGMSDLAAWRDLRKEAREYEAAARKAFSAGNFDLAVKQADKAREKYAALNNEVKSGDRVLISQSSALKAAMAGVASSGQLAVKALEAQKKAAREAADQLNTASGWQLAEKSIDKVTRATDTYASKSVHKVLKAWTETWDHAGRDGKAMIRDLDQAMNDLVSKPRHFKFKAVEAHALGGLAGWTRRRGRLPGFGGGDRIRALLEAGEIIINKYAVRKYGADKFLAYNALRMPVRARLGGQLVAPGMPPLRLPAAPAAAGGDTVYNLNVNFSGSVPSATRQHVRQLARQIMTELQVMHQGGSR